MTDLLKPCPFFGGEATLVYVDDRTWQVICDNCGSCSDYYDEEWNNDNPPEGKEAIKAWNKRQIEEDLETKRLREALEVILNATQKDEHSIMAIKAVAYMALKGGEE